MNSAIAFLTVRREIASPGYAAPNSPGYSSSSSSLVTTSGHRVAISTSFWMGPSIWSSSVSARPSQNCAMLKATLNTVGEFTDPSRPSTPTDTTLPSSPPLARSWQLAQDTVSFFESRGS